MLIYRNIIKSRMSEKRFTHCVNVSERAVELALQYGANTNKARIAGALHDITKENSYGYHMNIIKKYRLPINKNDIISKGVLHSITGSVYAEKILRIRDRDILNSIRFHTTGRAGMSPLEKVVFVADFTSKERDYAGVNKIRKFAETDLDLAALGCLLFTINNLLEIKMPIHPNTIFAYNDILVKKRQDVNF
ncbi:MAG: bis(5'-nucleosyl)-tetraphosphatase (symmetrical) YqeK [Candidatus Paraimprobicoccus trichonymphae]|uniref:bis(5'-nucleosyl)-tetraphosphatase (symmetrical) n=1 Tax=Candidatus Paraimprobicoccus trichonymphae TaxID=3033793 RepID=A0AA48HWH5_9FIRM|nr:MAG: bis(5'-nucleosyl)-tetraphosphatase (symmetrical) YqeK [Candidatus Paraimprobicoccus trichonymphae]